jgi:hypothetical protein
MQKIKVVWMDKWQVFIFAALALSCVVHADNGANLQLQGYTTLPETIYPGTSGQLQIIIVNTGAYDANGVTINYRSYDQTDTAQMLIGNIGASSSTTATLPFRIPQDSNGGFYTMDISVAYVDMENGGARSVPLNLPISVSQHDVLGVKTLSVSPEIVQPSESVTVKLRLENTGGVMNNVLISTAQNSTFSLSGSAELSVGSIGYNSTKDVSVVLHAASYAKSGSYTIPLLVSYDDSLQNTVTKTVSVGPVAVGDASAQLRVRMVPETEAAVGSETAFSLTVENLGQGAVSAMIDINQTEVFTPIGASRLYFDSIAPGTNATQKVSVGVSASTTGGYYVLPLGVTSAGNSYVQNVGITVSARPGIGISTSASALIPGSSGTTVSLEIANTGDNPIRSVYVSVASSDPITVSGTSDKFAGTLNVDDFTTFQFTVGVNNNAQPGTYAFPVKIEYKDWQNAQHSDTEYVNMTVYSAADAMMYGSNSTLGGRARATASPLSGPIPMVAGGAAVVIAGYFLYKKFKAKK